MLAKIKGYSSEEGYLIQPVNGMGEDDGKPMAEKVSDVWVLPPSGSHLQLNDEKTIVVSGYTLETQTVNCSNHEKTVTASGSSGSKKTAAASGSSGSKKTAAASGSSGSKKATEKRKLPKKATKATSATKTTTATSPPKKKKKTKKQKSKKKQRKKTKETVHGQGFHHRIGRRIRALSLHG